MLHQFYQHRRIVSIADFYNHELLTNVDIETSLRDLLAHLLDEEANLSRQIAYLKKYLTDNYSHAEPLDEETRWELREPQSNLSGHSAALNDDDFGQLDFVAVDNVIDITAESDQLA